MAAKGTESKAKITEKILEVFSNSFINDKEIRIPMIENGERVEIKCTLVCAKTNVGFDDMDMREPAKATSDQSPANLEITEEEKKEVVSLIDKLGL